nr:DUF4158 domain-containing protein [Nocardia carnea]
MFADEELARLREFPEIGREELFRFFTLSPADLAFVDPGRGRGPADRLSIAIALCTLPWLGFVPDRVVTAPPVAVARLAEQLRVDGTEIRSYGRRAQTPHRPFAPGRAVSGVADRRCARTRGTRRVPAGAGDGARFADPVVPVGV